MSVECLTYDADEVAVILGISKQSVYRLAEKQELPSRRFGSRLVFVRQEIHDLVNAPAPKGEDEGWMEKSSGVSAKMAPRPIRNG